MSKKDLLLSSILSSDLSNEKKRLDSVVIDTTISKDIRQIFLLILQNFA